MHTLQLQVTKKKKFIRRRSIENATESEQMTLSHHIRHKTGSTGTNFNDSFTERPTIKDQNCNNFDKKHSNFKY